MAIQSSLKNMVLVLSGTCLVCAGLLGGAYVLTEEPIAEAEKLATAKTLSAVLPEGCDAIDTEASTVEVDGVTYNYYKGSRDGEVIGYAIESKTGGFGGELVVMVGIDARSATIYNTAPLRHSETPGLGAKCTDATSGFRTQWTKGLPVADGPTPAVYAVTKEGGTIDAITASTITSKAYTKCVNQALAAFAAISSEAPVIAGSDRQSPVIPSEAKESLTIEEEPCYE